MPPKNVLNQSINRLIVFFITEKAENTFKEVLVVCAAKIIPNIIVLKTGIRILQLYRRYFGPFMYDFYLFWITQYINKTTLRKLFAAWRQVW